MQSVVSHLEPQLVGFVVALAIGLLIGIEREEHEPEGIGGVRTFPMMALAGFLLAVVFPDSVLPFTAGAVVLGGLLAVSHWHSTAAGEPGLTTEAAAVVTYILGACAARGLYWIAIAAGVVAVILLQEKRRLEGMATRLPSRELRILLRFLLLTGVILPVVPDASYTRFDINPFTIWLVVVAVCGVSYLSYLLQLWIGRHHGLILTGILGGAYSSTVTTVSLARQSRDDSGDPRHYAGAILAATGVMYLRLWVLVRLFAPALGNRLMALFWVLGAVGIVVGVLLGRSGPSTPAEDEEPRPSRNPLEMTTAFAFAGVFLVVLVLTREVAHRFGGAGLLVLAAIMGATDVDPFILGLTQLAAGRLDLMLAALAVVVAAASNNLMKGIYAATFGERRTGRLALLLLGAMGVLSLALYPFLL